MYTDGCSTCRQGLGSLSASTCPQQPDKWLVAAVVGGAPQKGVDALRAAFHAANPNLNFDTIGPEAISHAIAGGDDCKVTSAAGNQLVAVWFECATSYAQDQAGSVLPGDHWSWADAATQETGASGGSVSSGGGGSGSSTGTGGGSSSGGGGTASGSTGPAGAIAGNPLLVWGALGLLGLWWWRR